MPAQDPLPSISLSLFRFPCSDPFPMMTEKRKHLLFILTACTLTFLLFYIDEGYYNVNWMKRPGNWVAFFLYSGALAAGQVLINGYFFSNNSRLSGFIVASFAGMTAGAVFLFIFFGILYLSSAVF